MIAKSVPRNIDTKVNRGIKTPIDRITEIHSGKQPLDYVNTIARNL